MANYFQQAFPGTYGAWNGAGDAAEAEADKGNYGGAIGHTVRGALATGVGLLDDVGNSAKYIIDPWANMLKTAVTGEPLYPQQPAPAKPKAAPAPASASTPGTPVGGQLAKPPEMPDSDRARMGLDMGIGTDGKPLNGPQTRTPAGPIGGNDEYRKMADQLYGLSQQRAGTEGSIGVNGFMQQLQNIRALNDMTPMGGYNSLPDYAAQANAAPPSIDPTGLSKREYARLQLAQQKQMGDQRGTDLTYAAAMDRNRIAEQGQGLDYRGRLEAVDRQGRNQLAAAGLQGQYQLAGDEIRGRNQLENTRLGYGMQGDSQLALERLKQSDPEHAAKIGYYGDLGKYYQSGAKLHGIQANAAQRSLDYDQSLDGQFYKGVEAVAKLEQAGKTKEASELFAQLQASREYLRRKKEAEGKANGGLVGYADGGEVEGKETAEQILARMHAKYGVPAAGQEAPQPAPQPQQQQAPAPAPRQETWSEKLRRMATGGLEQRMRNYASGGLVNFGDDSTDGLKARLAFMQESNAGNIERGGYSAAMNGFNSASSAPKDFSRTTIGGIDHITDPNAPGGANYRKSDYDLGGYGTFSRSGFANGGPINVGGRQVLGDGDGKSDSLPAVIDGERPAALSTGEFVMPVETVQYYGLNRLNKMVAAARKGLDTGR